MTIFKANIPGDILCGLHDMNPQHINQVNHINERIIIN